jgi:hypothetical protein
LKQKTLKDDFVYLDTFYKDIIEHDNKILENRLIETKDLMIMNEQVKKNAEVGLTKVEWSKYGIKYE